MRIHKKNSASFASLLIFTGAFVLPASAHATVSINEVMYDPEGADAGREWVELYNGGAQDVTLVGGSGKGSWRINDSKSHTIADPAGGAGRGSLTVPAGGYLVLASDPDAFMSEYGGDYPVAKASLSLNNTGATVSLVDGDGAAVDSMTYAAGQGGSDNGTSLQLASSTWLQALPTPGAMNATQEYDPPEDAGSSKTPASSAGGAALGLIAPPLPDLFADAGADKGVIVGADAKFVASAYDRDKRVISYAKFLWNFGDGTTAQGPSVMHHWSFPGRYDVELVITNDFLSNTDRMMVTVEPAAVSLAPLPQGGVSIKNESGRDLDLSYWIVGEGDMKFSLPEHSVVLAGAAMNIAASTLGFAADAGAGLYYPDGSEVAAPQATSTPAVPASVVSDAAPASADGPAAEAASVPLMSVSAPEEPADPAPSAAPEAPAQALPAPVAAGAVPAPLWPIAGLGGLVAAGVASTFALRRNGATSAPAEEFTIE